MNRLTESAIQKARRIHREEQKNLHESSRKPKPKYNTNDVMNHPKMQITLSTIGKHLGKAAVIAGIGGAAYALASNFGGDSKESFDGGSFDAKSRNNTMNAYGNHNYQYDRNLADTDQASRWRAGEMGDDYNNRMVQNMYDYDEYSGRGSEEDLRESHDPSAIPDEVIGTAMIAAIHAAHHFNKLFD
jgi:hypothetical protein